MERKVYFNENIMASKKYGKIVKIQIDRADLTSITRLEKILVLTA